MTRFRKLVVTLAVFFVLAAAGSAESQTTSREPSPTPAPTHGVHTISVKFDYDFRVTPACTAQVTKKCVLQFVVYDISGGASATKRYKLFTVPLPPNPTGAVHGIAATGPRLDFESGKHLIGVTALEPVTSPDTESNPQACTAWVTLQ